MSCADRSDASPACRPGATVRGERAQSGQNLVQFSTAGDSRGRYTGVMPSENMKTVLFTSWVVGVCLVAMALGATSLTQWVIIASVAVVPPTVIRSFWHMPERTMSESIREARR